MVIDIDYFHMHHVLELQMRILSDDEVALIETVRLKNVDKINLAALRAATKRFKGTPRGAWYLFQV